jgi:DNA-binding IclR family transcriptional regulator
MGLNPLRSPGSDPPSAADLQQADENGAVAGRPRNWTAKPSVQDVPSAVPPSVKSAARAFRVIEFFAEVRRPARANEIASRLGFPQSSTSVLLNSLVRLGYLDYEVAAHTYFPSLRIAILGAWLDHGHFRDGSIMRVLEALSEETGYAISLASRTGIYVRYLHTIQARAEDSYHIPLSTRRYAVWSTAGIALLSETPEDEIRALIRRTRAEPGDLVKTIDASEVLSLARRAREQGYLLADGFVIPHTQQIAMRLPRHITGEWQDVALVVGANGTALRDCEARLAARMRELIGAIG